MRFTVCGLTMRRSSIRPYGTFPNMEAPEPNVQDLLNLKNRVAIVTGACGWLGSAISRALAEAGARVAVTSRDESRAVEFAKTLPGTGHLGLGFRQGDAETVAAFIGAVVERL